MRPAVRITCIALFLPFVSLVKVVCGGYVIRSSTFTSLSLSLYPSLLRAKYAHALLQLPPLVDTVASYTTTSAKPPKQELALS